MPLKRYACNYLHHFKAFAYRQVQQNQLVNFSMIGRLAVCTMSKSSLRA